MGSVRFAGMDVHKDSIQLAVLTDQRGDREIEFERQVASDLGGVKKVVRRLRRDHRVVAGYEAGCIGIPPWMALSAAVPAEWPAVRVYFGPGWLGGARASCWRCGRRTA